MSDELKIGDVVVLKSGGPRMTIQATNLGKVQASWFEGPVSKSEGYAPASLRLATEDDE